MKIRKVKCISNCENQFYLTIGKEYTALDIRDGWILVENDKGDKHEYLSERFEPIKEKTMKLSLKELAEKETRTLSEIKWDGKSSIKFCHIEIYPCSNYTAIKIHNNNSTAVDGDVIIRIGGIYNTTLDEANQILALYGYKIVIEEPKYKIKIDGEYTAEEIKKLEEIGLKFEKMEVRNE